MMSIVRRRVPGIPRLACCVAATLSMANTVVIAAPGSAPPAAMQAGDAIPTTLSTAGAVTIAAPRSTPPAAMQAGDAIPTTPSTANAVAIAAPRSAPPAAVQAGDAIPDGAIQRLVLDQSYAYFAAKDGGRYDAAYAWFAPSVQAYLTPELYRAQTAEFNAGAGKGERRIVTLTWERDPPEAPAPGLYVAADFMSRFANLRLHCGYLMWHREADGQFRIVREEQSFLDNAAASRLTPERLRPAAPAIRLPGCHRRA